jgi:hypothetical protein
MPRVTNIHPTAERPHALDALRGMPAAISSATRSPLPSRDRAAKCWPRCRARSDSATRRFHHMAITYGANGLWYHREVMPDGGPGSKLLTLMCSVDQAFFMAINQVL